MRKNAPPSVTVHEIAHYMEEKDPDLHKRAVDFLIKRSEGKPVERIRDKLNKNYDPEEIAVQDDWKDLYTGKIYVGNTRQQQRRFADKVAGRTFSASEIPELAKDIRATEILSMGAEKLYNDPIKFAQEEPDFFKFMINAAKGVQA